MSVLPIVTYEDDVLYKKADPVKTNSDQFQTLVDDMFDTMYNADGVGLAAPQVGKLLRVFVTDAAPFYDDESDEEPPEPMAFINPKITLESDETVTMEEGCLSIPEVLGPVTRPEKVVVKFKDRDFKNQKLEVKGPLARVIQHELDHLNGVLFVDHLSFFKKKLVSSKLKALAEGSVEIEYPVVPKAVS